MSAEKQLLSRIAAAQSSGDPLVISDTQFSPDSRLRSKRDYAHEIIPFDLHPKGGGWRNRLLGRKPVWRNLVFRNCAISGLAFTNWELEDCVFENCELAIRNWKTSYRRNRFVDCDMRSFSFGADTMANSNSFADVTFDRCRLQSARLDYTEFEDCRFVDCHMKRAEFRQATLRRTTFAGKLDDVIFGCDDLAPTVLDSVDFATAHLSFCAFRNVKASGIKPPVAAGQHMIKDFIGFIQALDDAVTAHAGDKRIRLSDIFTSDHMPGSEIEIVNENDFQEFLDAEGRTILAGMLADPRCRP
ncbi:hypothetical protein GAO09_19955 [Rhizobiales bacterium RZME27]|uniref:Pentapeptide repeat-containing protein n=1 Tax=Endobacterium cereale TaxID=2663029 RepID=A0A6A8AHQ4_9HYPH|nr:pentapeptide repeat-containing protein [Endobacterium cereale]MEB2846100.1 pentapeptide repeat-containing protein [Endobacterium cereale]MQY48311.1 hypothetical protein [Endobacterium cereale]